MKKIKVNIGDVFGRLTVLSEEPRKIRDSGVKIRMVKFICECGDIIVSEFGEVRRGNIQSCGCLRKEVVSIRSKTHGLTDTREYAAYAHAKDRCCNKNNNAYHRYGGRGIQFKFKSFQQFIDHLGKKPNKMLSIERIDNDGHYEIGNVKWAGRSEQALNKSVRKNNTTGCTGVSKSGSKFHSSIMWKGHRTFLGVFNNYEDAKRAYLNKKRVFLSSVSSPECK